MVPKSPDDESGVLEEDSAPGDATVNKTFKVSGSEMNEDEAGVLSNNLMLSDATGLTVDSIEHTPPGNEDVDTTNSTMHTPGLLTMDSKGVYEVDANVAVPDDVDSDKSMVGVEGTAEESQREELSEDKEPKGNTVAARVARPNLRGASKDDVDARAN
ncbi:hypothetical protein MHU86_8689 [Fragilaria crotonensis]|nr:hypothetical protein MHU86_8689 [Fragilaria crotonensis]